MLSYTLIDFNTLRTYTAMVFIVRFESIIPSVVKKKPRPYETNSIESEKNTLWHSYPFLHIQIFRFV